MNDTMIKPKAYSYLRFSTADQAKGDSYRRQTALAEEYARQKGLDLDKELTFQDLGVSAFRGRNKKHGALRAFLDAVEEEIIPAGSYLLVESLDRVSREAILDAQATFLQIVNAGITLVTLKGNPKEYSREAVNANPVDLLVSLLEMIRAREESETKSQRIKADWSKKRERAAAGEAVTSQIPAWLTRVGKGFEVVPERVEVVRRIFELALSGKGQHGITAILNKDGVPPFGRAKWWHRSYVKRVLESPSVIGTFSPNRMVAGGKEALEPVLNYFPRVIDQETFDAVRALDRPTGRAPTTDIASLFSGLARCEQCGGPMTRTRKGTVEKGFYRTFACQNAKLGQSCEYRSVRQSVLENALIENIHPFIEEAPTHDETLAAEARDLHIGIIATREQIEGLVDLIVRRPTTGRLVARLEQLEAELALMVTRHDEIEAALRDAARPVVVKRLSGLEDALLGGEGPDLARANVVLRQVVERVVVEFDREVSRRRPRGYMRFVWKGGAETMLRWGSLFAPLS